MSEKNNNVPAIRFAGFTDAWERRKLGDVVKDVSGNDGRTDLPILTISASLGWLEQKERFSQVIAGNQLQNYTLLRKGELSYNHGNSKLAKYGVVIELKDLNEALVPKVYHSIKCSKYANPTFLEYLFWSKIPDGELGKLISSSARMDGLLNISKQAFLGINITIPSVIEQTQIGNFFKQLDDTIANHQGVYYLSVYSVLEYQNPVSSLLKKELSMSYQQPEAKFEQEIITRLSKHGWTYRADLSYKTEDELLAHWREILFERNVDRLNHIPLSDTEFEQLKQQIFKVKTPIEAGKLLNTGLLELVRDVKGYENTKQFLEFFWRHDVGTGKNSYEIVNQTYRSASKVGREDHRFDVTLLISGVPVIHIELKRTGVSLKSAYNQLREYAEAGDFTGFYSLVQIFAILNPDESRYFANPGHYTHFNPLFCFPWANFQNQHINDAGRFVEDVLSVPMGHKLVSLYTILDDKKNALKVLRSYQIFAVEAILDKLRKANFETADIDNGGYIWHTTGSGKTMTSFKAAQLVSQLPQVDKVIFLADRNELVNQTHKEYDSFADHEDEITDTQNSYALLKALASRQDKLIVTSIQKMSNVSKMGKQDKLDNTRIVFIIDEAHRSTNGEMLIQIRQQFKTAIWFGFTGTPLLSDDSADADAMGETAQLFGNPLHIYSVADGIADNNVLAFDVRPEFTFDRHSIRQQVALQKDPSKGKLYFKWVHDKSDVDVVKAVPESNYTSDEHRQNVVKSLLRKWDANSFERLFSGMLAVRDIQSAVAYFELLKDNPLGLKIAMIYDDSDQHEDDSLDNKLALEKAIFHYNQQYQTEFGLNSVTAYKDDLMNRLSRRDEYQDVENHPEQRLDLVIVVWQLLTGYDAPYLNTLYLDKMLEGANLIQAFSRTNRITDSRKPFGIIEYYRRPELMKQNIDQAFSLYSNKNAKGLMYVNNQAENIVQLNDYFTQMVKLFPKNAENQPDFGTLPEDNNKNQFVRLMNELEKTMIKVRQQGFSWETQQYAVDLPEIEFTEQQYAQLQARYDDLAQANKDPTERIQKGPLDIEPLLSSGEKFRIDVTYLASLLNKLSDMVQQPEAQIDQAKLDELKQDIHQLFNSLRENDRRIAEMILLDIQRGDLGHIDDFSTVLDQYRNSKENQGISAFVDTLGIDREMFIKLLNQHVLGKDDWQDYGLLEKLTKSADNDLVRDAFLSERVNEKPTALKLKGYLRDKIKAEIERLLLAR